MNEHLEQLDQLERDGYAVFPNTLDESTTARLRAHIDSLLPPVAPPEEAEVPRVHMLRHPIPGAIMAEALDNRRLLELAQQLLHARDMRLVEQVLIRTDAQQAAPGVTGPTGWHIDMTFLPEHYHARPRQTYFQMVHALSTIVPHGGATMVVPGSHHKTYQAARELGLDGLERLKADPIGVAGLDLNDAVEVLANEGDLVVFNPMCLHSASLNLSQQPRYVYFTSFMDKTAVRLQEHMINVNYQRAFSDSLRDNLRPALHPLLDD